MASPHTTLVLGASPDPFRYSHAAISRLVKSGEKVLALGRHRGVVEGISIHTDPKEIEGNTIDTLTLYLSPYNQRDMEEWIMQLDPLRVIFNPGSENPAFARRLREQDIEVIEACTLVMISTGQYRRLSEAR